MLKGQIKIEKLWNYKWEFKKKLKNKKKTIQVAERD
jgi:hypothetical protein